MPDNGFTLELKINGDIDMKGAAALSLFEDTSTGITWTIRGILAETLSKTIIEGTRQETEKARMKFRHWLTLLAFGEVCSATPLGAAFGWEVGAISLATAIIFVSVAALMTPEEDGGDV